MPIHHTNELIFDIPDEFIDKTSHIFSLSHDGPSEFNIVITHHPIGLNETLQTYANQMITELKKALPQFQLISNDTEVIAEQPALKIVYSWFQENQTLYQIQVSFFSVDHLDKRQVIQITATSLNMLSEKWDKVFANILNSIKLRQNI